MLETVVISLLVLVGVMSGLWLVSVFRRDVSIADPFWGMGFVIVVAVGQWRSLATDRSILLVTLTLIWGIRLSGFLIWRNWGHGEDRRYGAMRAHHGQRFWWWSCFSVFWLQALILWFVALPQQLAIAAAKPEPLGILDLLGGGVWAVGLAFESLGDWQLARFKSRPENAGRVMDRGLWRYTRHPNYFGDFCVIWGFYIVAFAGGAGLTIASPILMSFLLLQVSGVRLLEQTISERRPAYADYIRRTSAFFPLPPRNSP